jgi:hypothetical protein
VPRGPVNHEEVDAALEALTQPGRLREAETRVAEMAPQLQVILLEALKNGGWFDAHESQVRQAAGADGEPERAAAIRMLLADQTRMGMLVGVAVGWELGRELDGRTDTSNTTDEGA